MHILRTTILPVALAVALLVPAAALAQQATSAPNSTWSAGAHQHRSRSAYMRAMRSLNLSAQQKTQLQQLRQQFKSAHPAGSQPDPQARKQLRTNVLNVLTPAQRQQFKQNLKTMRQRRRRQQTGTSGTP